MPKVIEINYEIYKMNRKVVNYGGERSHLKGLSQEPCLSITNRGPELEVVQFMGEVVVILLGLLHTCFYTDYPILHKLLDLFPFM